MKKEILFFADRLPPLTGGVEMHARYFIEHFTHHSQFPLIGIITKDGEGNDCLINANFRKATVLSKLFNQRQRRCRAHELLRTHKFAQSAKDLILFFNSGRWIEDLLDIHQLFPKSFFVYRTGGNEILKAPLIHRNMPDHTQRQAYWAHCLNQTIDLIITNSQFTEGRLRKLGITSPFRRFVGGVSARKILHRIHVQKDDPKKKSIRLFCAARFVPYKNHLLLLDVVEKLVLKGYDIQLRLAGDGPLLQQAKEFSLKHGLDPRVQFLGVLDNEDVCQEIVEADIYVQFSSDQVTEVPGGSYIHAEGMGRSILEAITAGTYVVAGRSGALEEIINDRNGMLIDLKCQETISLQMVQAIVKQKKGPFSDRYCWTRIFKGYEEIYENLACY